MTSSPIGTERTNRRKRPSEWPGIVLAILAVLVFVILAFGCNMALRQHKIDQCEEHGGKAITHSVWEGNDYYKVGCIEP